MKKIYIFLMGIIVVIIFCGLIYYAKQKSNLLPAAEGAIITYTSSPTYGTVEEINNYFMIEVYSDKSLRYGYYNDQDKMKISLNEDEYTEIIKLAFGNVFNNLADDISDKNIMDGSEVYISLFYSDGTSRKIGGINPRNTTFDRLVTLLLRYTE